MYKPKLYLRKGNTFTLIKGMFKNYLSQECALGIINKIAIVTHAYNVKLLKSTKENFSCKKETIKINRT